MNPVLISPAQLEAFTAKLFLGKGLSKQDARTISEVLVWADLRGVETHGVSRVPLYLGWVDKGIIAGDAKPSMRQESLGAYVLDAGRAPGPVAMILAADGAVRKARQAGIGAVLVARTTHTGALGFYVRRVVDAGCACLAFAGSGLHMPYHGTSVAAVSTSPLAIGVPAGQRGALVLDMAMSIVSAGRLMLSRRTGEALPPGSAIDRDGVLTTDPQQAVLPLPIAGPKGAGLSLMIEILTGLLTNDPILAEALAEPAAMHRQNAMVIAIDIAQFVAPAAFEAGVNDLADRIAALPRQPGIDVILMPGERGDRIAEQRKRDGIAVPRLVWDQLVGLARELGVEAPDTTA